MGELLVGGITVFRDEEACIPIPTMSEAFDDPARGCCYIRRVKQVTSDTFRSRVSAHSPVRGTQEVHITPPSCLAPLRAVPAYCRLALYCQIKSILSRRLSEPEVSPRG